MLYLFLTLLFGFVLAFLFVCLFVCEFSNSVCPCKFVGQRRTRACQEKLWSTEHSAVGGDPWFYWEVYVFSGGLSQELCYGTEPIILWNSTGVRAAITGTCAYYSNWAKVLILGKNRWNSACSGIYIIQLRGSWVSVLVIGVLQWYFQRKRNFIENWWKPQEFIA